MPTKIIRLPESVINQIAAGEVVENPASIIKELVENCIDAGASQIVIRIRGGGQLLIEVEDNGCGMSSEDAVLSLERHATSKIRTAEDLSTLTTMGFRGEAVAAIASVSLMEIKTSDGNEATWIKTKGGVIEEMTPCARNQGTTVTVRSLFFNVPARKKFQKSISANTAQVTRVVETIACAHPEIAFSYFSQDERILHLPKQEKRERIEAIFGSFEHMSERSDCWGLFKSPSHAKSTRRDQLLFINKRPIFSPLIAKAVKAAYGTRLDENMYPPFVLFLEVDPSLVDVNVHPQKREVRFAQESVLFSKVETLVTDLFYDKPFFSKEIVFEETPFLLGEAPAFSYPAIQQTLDLEIPYRPLYVLGQYLLLEKEGLYLVDLQSARTRIFFEEVSSGKPEMQTLLWPIEIQESDPEVLESLQKMGIECRWIGEKKMLIETIPSAMDEADFPMFLQSWKEGKKLETIRFNSGKKYTLEEASHIWQRLEKRLYDPSGKKIWTKVEQGNLECLLKESIGSKKQ